MCEDIFECPGNDSWLFVVPRLNRKIETEMDNDVVVNDMLTSVNVFPLAV